MQSERVLYKAALLDDICHEFKPPSVNKENFHNNFNYVSINNE